MGTPIWLPFLLLLVVCSSGCRTRSAEGPPPDADGALMTAIRDNSPEEVRRLIALGVTPNPKSPGENAVQSPLAVATLKGSLETTQILLDAGADPNGREYRGWATGRTPLMIASGLGRVDLVTLLLQRGALVNLRAGGPQIIGRISSVGDAALFDATASGHADAVRILLLWGATSSRADLYSAISRGRDDLAWLLLSAGADPRWILSRGRSALEEAERLPPQTRGPMVATIRSFLSHDPPVGGIHDLPMAGTGPTGLVR